MKPSMKNLFIFEVANNHQGDVQHGLKIIDEMARIARQHRVNAAVKFQYRDLPTFIHPDYKARKDVKHIPRFVDTELSAAQFSVLQDAVFKAGLLKVTTPFDERSVQTCVEHGVDILKVASCSAT